MRRREVNVRGLQTEYLEKVIDELKRAIDPDLYSEEFLRSRFYEKYEKYLQPKIVKVYQDELGPYKEIEITFKFDSACNHRQGHLFVFSYRREGRYGELEWVFYRTPKSEYKLTFEVRNLTPEFILSMMDELSAMEVLNF